MTLVEAIARETPASDAFVTTVFAALRSAGIEAVLADLCGDRLALTVEDLADADSLRASLDTVACVRLETGLAMVSAVGEGLAADPAVAADALAALRGLPVHLVARPPGQRTLAFVVDATHAAAAMARLHDGFFGVAPGRAPASRPVVQA